ncbi:hypothetical protein Cabys_2124 [Caldithrix abyssi DSM 13497]|uniref:Uncharacterized protein n=1 Tax=Caldithrix abyssi DSM 13497 TaxID=880073 RepID=A0A1J1C9C4_CALAY|nr:hypothetical protein Cabys_2124 [Caldithrix abyssi DSM 13497]
MMPALNRDLLDWGITMILFPPSKFLLKIERKLSPAQKIMKIL